MRKDPGIETLLDLHDQAFDQGEGYWLKIKAWRVDTTSLLAYAPRALWIANTRL